MSVVGGRYRLGPELGRGGMGVVHRAVDARTGREVALKLVPKASVAEWQRLVREGRALAALEHPNIVSVLDAGDAGKEAFLVMTLVNGRSLAERLRHGALQIAEACAIVEGVARALAHAHAHGVLHRDVKPANVLLAQDGTPRLCDFGLARQAGDGRLTTTGEVVGTPSFMAPEQARGEVGATGPWTDSWGVGALLYTALTGRPPFEGTSVLNTILQVMEREPAAPSALRPDVPAALEALCLRCLEKDATRRPTALQVVDALAGLRAAEGRARVRAARARPRGSHRSVAIAGGVGGLAIVAALVVTRSLAPRAEPDDQPAAAVASVAEVEVRVTPPAPPRPASPDASLGRARAHLDAKDFAAAAAALRDAVAISPTRTPLLRKLTTRLGADLADHADDAIALQVLTDALGDTPLAGEVWVALSERHTDFGQFAAAHRAGRRAVPLLPERSPLRAWAMALGAGWSPRPEESFTDRLRLADEALESAPGDLEAHLVRGRFRVCAPYRDREDLDIVGRGTDPVFAARALTSIGAELLDLPAAARACELDPSSAVAWAIHGYVLSRDQPRAAMASFDRALALDPRCISALKNRGVTRIQLADARGALDDLDELIRLWPDTLDGYSWHARAAANAALGRSAAAIADLELAVLLVGPRDRAQVRDELAQLRGGRGTSVDDLPAGMPVAVRVGRADILQERGELEQARIELEGVLRADPTMSLAQGMLALVLVLERKHEAARAQAARCTEPSGFHALALVLMQDPASIAAVDAALAHRPDHHLAHLARALVCRSFADRRGAASAVAAGLKAKTIPRSGWSRRLLEAIERWASGP